jgi:diaminohydroxyphosphoribosylaminopyrimidine deaminase/5-amino-6-(5-phosphoribosylamino)uracil reductase
MASGESKWITGAQARADVHRMRALSAAILTGSGTVIADNPSMNYRAEEYEQLSTEVPSDTEQPLKVVIDSELKVPVSSAIFKQSGQAMVATLKGNDNIEAFTVAGLPVSEYDAENGKVPLKTLLSDLAALEINDVMVEAGPGLAGALLDEKLVDELVIYMAPHLMGDAARGMLNLPALNRMSDRVSVKIHDIRAIGDDWKIIASPVYS